MDSQRACAHREQQVQQNLDQEQKAHSGAVGPFTPRRPALPHRADLRPGLMVGEANRRWGCEEAGSARRAAGGQGISVGEVAETDVRAASVMVMVCVCVCICV